MNTEQNGSSEAKDGLFEYQDAASLRESVVAACREQGTWRPIDEWLVDQFVEMVSLARQAEEQYRAEGLTVTGARGHEAAHPALRIAAQVRQAALRCLDRLLLTPEQRRKHRLSDLELDQPFSDLFKELDGG
jgi:P27 family predicted phage terminase small subunit